MIDDSLKDLLAQCFRSTKVCAKVLFPERFTRPFASIHDELFGVLDNDNIRQVVIAAPRGFGKTSIMNLAYPAKKILFREKRFIVPISNTSTQAVMQSENLKMELLTNIDVARIFGSIKAEASQAFGPFSKEMWVTESGTAVLPRGAGQQVRGLLFGHDRPDLILIDDLEDAESVRSEDQRKKLKEWFFADVMNSVNRQKNNWKIVVMGTLLHEDSLLANLLEDKNWNPIRLELCDDNYESNWPDYMTTAEVIALFDQYRKQGLLDAAYREFRNMAISTEDATFLASYFRQYDEAEAKLDRRPEIENVVIIDPAKTVKMHSDYSAVVGVGVDTLGGSLYIRDLDAKMMHPDQLYDSAMNMCRRLKARVLAVEVTSLDEFITYPLRTIISKSGLDLELVELKARGKKEDRIASLVPLYRKGMIYHNPRVCGVLEAQLLSFPRSKRIDAADATAYISELLEQGERYFLPSNAVSMERREMDSMDKEDKEQLDDISDYDEREWDNIILGGSYLTI